ncbi:MAG: TerC family protein [Planctomycetes bacterium]|nr:TerC family protein [Planctomycetota bacterium]
MEAAAAEAVRQIPSVLSAEAWAALATPEVAIAVLTLTALEIVLGIDNIVFISVLTGRLPPELRPKARRTGLLLAMVMRILLLLSVSWIMSLTRPLVEIAGFGLTGQRLILLAGGAFLLYKSVKEIHHKVEGHVEQQDGAAAVKATMGAVLVQIALIDLVFSLDSVITAVGMTTNIPAMIIAVVSSVMVMMWAAGPIGDFVERHPAVKILALAFLILIGVMLIAEGLGQHMQKGYIYFAMAFALVVELLQIRMQKNQAHPH